MVNLAEELAVKHALGGPIEIKCRDYNELPDDYPRAFCDGVECRYLGGMPLELNKPVQIRVEYQGEEYCVFTSWVVH